MIFIAELLTAQGTCEMAEQVPSHGLGAKQSGRTGIGAILYNRFSTLL